MKLLSKKLFFFTLFFIFSFETKAKDSARFSVGGGIFNYMEDGTEPPHNDQSNMINLEIVSGKENV